MPIIRVFDSTFGDRSIIVPAQIPVPGAATIAGQLNLVGQAVINSAGFSPVATGSDVCLATFTIPANALAPQQPGLNPGFNLYAFGSFANNGNTKRAKIIFAPTAPVVGAVVATGTVIADTGNYSTAALSAWALQCTVFKYGVLGSNTQIGLHSQAQIAATIATLVVPTLLTAPEAAPIPIAITGNAGSVGTDVVFNVAELEPLN